MLIVLFHKSAQKGAPRGQEGRKDAPTPGTDPELRAAAHTAGSQCLAGPKYSADFGELLRVWAFLEHLSKMSSSIHIILCAQILNWALPPQENA